MILEEANRACPNIRAALVEPRRLNRNLRALSGPGLGTWE
jgi:hypothetical protein